MYRVNRGEALLRASSGNQRALLPELEPDSAGCIWPSNRNPYPKSVGILGMMATLRSPCPELKGAFLRMAQEWREHGVDRYRSVLEDFESYLAEVRRFEDPGTVPPDWVRCTEFCLEVDGEIVGCARLRFELNALLEQEGGHIGYDVRPSARGRGFGNLLLRLVLPEAQRAGLERALITVDADNYPSLRIVEKNGGALAGEVVSAKSGKPVKRYWIDLTACRAAQ